MDSAPLAGVQHMEGRLCKSSPVFPFQTDSIALKVGEEAYNSSVWPTTAFANPTSCVSDLLCWANQFTLLTLSSLNLNYSTECYCTVIICWNNLSVELLCVSTHLICYSDALTAVWEAVILGVSPC